jgi:tetrapyrrole methylase family protein/MazG family protein
MSTKELQRLVSIISTLRGSEGCPWDREQDFASMRPYLLEEVYEVLDAMDKNDPEGLHEELGDLLFVVLLLCQIGTDEKRFTLDSLCRKIANKMVVRHPHVFGEGKKVSSAAGSLEIWEREKARKKPRQSRLDGVPRTLPALLRAHRQGEKAAAVGFDWPDHTGVLDKVEEELGELRAAIAQDDQSAIRHELGDVLMSLSSLGRHLKASPEEALREANDRFADRFRKMEEIARETQIDMLQSTSETLENLWEQAKAKTS